VEEYVHAPIPLHGKFTFLPYVTNEIQKYAIVQDWKTFFEHVPKLSIIFREILPRASGILSSRMGSWSLASS
jgi:hypothetical protein